MQRDFFESLAVCAEHTPLTNAPVHASVTVAMPLPPLSFSPESNQYTTNNAKTYLK